jgi:hypothetical protein
MIIRGAIGRRTPYGEVSVGDILNFNENKGVGLLRTTAEVQEVLSSEKMTQEESLELAEKNQDKLIIDVWLLKRFAGKRYIELITVKTFEELVPFKFDRSKYPKMEDWLLVQHRKLKKIGTGCIS